MLYKEKRFGVHNSGGCKVKIAWCCITSGDKADGETVHQKECVCIREQEATGWGMGSGLVVYVMTCKDYSNLFQGPYLCDHSSCSHDLLKRYPLSMGPHC